MVIITKYTNLKDFREGYGIRRKKYFGDYSSNLAYKAT